MAQLRSVRPWILLVALACARISAGETIMEIQGAAHRSALAGRSVGGVVGIVTARASSGFYLQDPAGDGDPATSDALFVYTRSAPGVAAGDRVEVAGTVFEYRPGCSSSATLEDETCTARSRAFHNLTVTEIVAPSVTLLSSGHPLPAATSVGGGGPLPPLAISSAPGGDVEDPAYPFDRTRHALDFFEALEGMRVAVGAPVAVGPTDAFGVLPVLADGGAGQGAQTRRGGVAVTAESRNGGRILLDDALVATPEADVGDRLDGALGIVDYRFGGYRLRLTHEPTLDDRALPKQTAHDAAADAFSIAAFNVENLAATSPPAKIAGIATEIATNLGAPAIVALVEMQDDSGPANDGVASAGATFTALTTAIEAAGGPAYEFVQIDPADGADGGEPGGNIRAGFLYDRRRAALGSTPPRMGDATTAIRVEPDGRWNLDVGRVDPGNRVWSASRKPLAVRFEIGGQTLVAIALHLRSKSGDGPLFGRFQPPIESSRAAREAQADVVGGFVEEILAADPDAAVVALGDLNDFDFSPALARLEAAGLHNLTKQLPESERYSYVFDGNAQALDHVLVSESLASTARYEIVHVNSEYRDSARASDHDPGLAVLAVPAPEPEASVSGVAALVALIVATRRKCVDVATQLDIHAAGERYQGCERSSPVDFSQQGASLA